MKQMLAVLLVVLAIALACEFSGNGEWGKDDLSTSYSDENSEPSCLCAGPKIHIYKKTETDFIMLSDGDIVAENDEIQIAYFSRFWKFGTILSLDGRGVVTLHYPATTASDTILATSSNRFPLPYAFKLDDAPDFEKFFFFVSNKPIHVCWAIRTLEQMYKQNQSVPRLKLGVKIATEFLLKKKESSD